MPRNTGIDPLTGLEALRWRCIGPPRGGRVVAVAGDPDNRMTFYFGACAGGVWKTEDGGTYWQCVSDGFLSSATIGALTVAPSNPNVIYAGTGETTIRVDVSYGDGIYRSSDAGRSWTHMGPGRQPSYRPDPDPPGRSGSRLCRRPGRCVRSQLGAWCLSLHQWRRELGTGAGSRPRRGSDRSELRSRSCQSAGSLRLRSGRRGAVFGNSRVAGRVPACSSPGMAATAGRISRSDRACPRVRSARSG